MKKNIAGLIGSLMFLSVIVGPIVSAQTNSSTPPPQRTSPPPNMVSPYGYGYPYGNNYPYNFGYNYPYGYPVYDPLTNLGNLFVLERLFGNNNGPLFTGTTNLGDLFILDQLFRNTGPYYRYY